MSTPEEDFELHKRRLLHHRRCSEERAELVEQQQERQSMVIEKEVLVDLWKDLGDFTETYWQAMTGVKVFAEVVLYGQDELKGLKAPIAARVAKAVGLAFIAQAAAITETAGAIEEMDARHEAEHP